MSIKLYNGYRRTFSDGFDLLRWQNDLARLRAKMEKDSKAFMLNDLLMRALYRMDRCHAGLPPENPEHSHIHAAYKAVEKDCEDLRKGHRRPTLDPEVNLSWKLIPDNGNEYQTVLCLVYAERPHSEAIVAALGLEDFHYQNQTDPPEGMPWEEMVARGETWEAALGEDWNNPPAAFFHNFLLCPSPAVPMIGWLPEPPVLKPKPLEERAHDIAFDVVFKEVADDDSKGKDLWARVSWLRREVKEGRSMHGRMQEAIAEVSAQLIAEPTYEDLKAKPLP